MLHRKSYICVLFLVRHIFGAAASKYMIHDNNIAFTLLQGFSWILDELENYLCVVSLEHYKQVIYDAYAKAQLKVKCFEELRLVCIYMCV